MIVLALIGLVAIAAAAIALAGIRLRAERRGEEPFDPVRVEREVYEHLYGGGPALPTTPTQPTTQARQRAQRSREKLGTKRPATG